MNYTEELIKFLIEKNHTIATAESCTAGMIAARLGDVPGVSEIFAEGFITYSNDAKEKLLGVPHEVLSNFGAVSAETATEMALGVCKRTGAKIGLSATGIAGPDGGTKEKPVGLVYIGICIDGVATSVKCNFCGDRFCVRTQTVDTAFAELGKILNFSVDK